MFKYPKTVDLKSDTFGCREARNTELDHDSEFSYFESIKSKELRNAPEEKHQSPRIYFENWRPKTQTLGLASSVLSFETDVFEESMLYVLVTEGVEYPIDPEDL